ncbi:MAG: ChaN family lipoprotein [Sporocytophaga sp.]|uniref:ChaN family lipoprotein n=1 Tax=Sporocytophaga sp. TaxID=2231183 RepID=UPI001B06C1A0|nr:ChaN family lipoprotein [Sporocytophaga sp.]MBO9699450.1 ChaN family lipoprotein [Sporocytophaga sp.]
MNRLVFYLLFTLLPLNIFAQDAYTLFDKQGKKVSYDKFLSGMESADIILFGEIHDNALCHWLQLQVLKSLEAVKKGKVVVGGEFFEADDQIIIDEYLKGYFSLTNFKDEAKTWSNFEQAYLPIIQFSKEKHLTFIATNIPRRYASLVAKKGIDSLQLLQSEAFKWIVPLPFDIDKNLPGYKQLAESSSQGHAFSLPFMIEAQAIKDATMAHFINLNRAEKIFFHINGSYHSDGFEGIYWYLKKKNPSQKIITVSSKEQKNLSVLDKENLNIADYIICFPEDMIRTK